MTSKIPYLLRYKYQLMLTALKGSLVLFAIIAASVVPCGGPKLSHCTSSIVQIIFSFWSFEISAGIRRGLSSRNRGIAHPPEINMLTALKGSLVLFLFNIDFIHFKKDLTKNKLYYWHITR